MQGDLELIQQDIGSIKRSLRALQHFVEHRFPVPVRSRSPMTRSIPDGTDPVTAFALKYVEDLDKRGVIDKRRAVLERARAHPTNRYDRSGQEIAH